MTSATQRGVARIQKAGDGALSQTGNIVQLFVDVARQLFVRPFQWREFIQQAWFIASVTILPTALIAIPFGAIVSLQTGSLIKQLGAESFTGAASVLAVVQQASPIVTTLVIAGAGGVGSMAIQLARRSGFTVIATASRPETLDWCRTMGAHHVVDHRQPLAPQLSALGYDTVEAVANFASTDAYWDAIGEIIAPLGHVGLIVEPAAALKIGDPYKAKSVGIHWEMMFARPRFRTPDMIEQHRLLGRVASLIDAGQLRSTHTETLGPINAANLREAHRRLESGTTVGKLVLAGW